MLEGIKQGYQYRKFKKLTIQSQSPSTIGEGEIPLEREINVKAIRQKNARSFLFR